MPRGRDTSRDPRRRAVTIQWDPIQEEYLQKLQDREQLSKAKVYGPLMAQARHPFNFDNPYLFSGLYWTEND